MPYRYFIQLSYEGSAFGGWQSQPNAATIQWHIEEALKVVAGIQSGVTGCGRTDAGVHARQFFAHFEPEQPIHNSNTLVNRLNRFLPHNIAIHSLFPVQPECHARFSATFREYHYSILRRKNPFKYQRSFYYYGDLDVKLMNDAAQILLQHTNFESFSKVNTQVASFNCRMDRAEWISEDDELIFIIRADRFLRNMVRAIVGTLTEVGRKRITLDQLEAIVLSRDRKKAGMSVPAKGLTLWSVGYPEGIELDEPVWFSEKGSDKKESKSQAHSQFHESTGNKAEE